MKNTGRKSSRFSPLDGTHTARMIIEHTLRVLSQTGREAGVSAIVLIRSVWNVEQTCVVLWVNHRVKSQYLVNEIKTTKDSTVRKYELRNSKEDEKNHQT